jgi:hypothetical protein
MAFLSESVTDRLYYSADQAVLIIKVDSASKNKVYKLRKDKQELIPGQRVVGNELMLDLPKEELTVGFYDLLHEGKANKVLAFNFDKSESYLDQYIDDDLKKVFKGKKNIQLFDVDDSVEFSKEMKEQKSGLPLWKYALLLALLFLLMEVLLIRFFKTI